jgi:hypothetical protein
MRSRRALTLLSIVAMMGFVACHDTPTRPAFPATRSRVSQQLSQSALSRVVTFDDYLDSVALQEPAFAGMYIENGTLIVMLTDLSRPAESVRAAITRVFSSTRLSVLPIQARQATYSWTQLYTWGKALKLAFTVPNVWVTDLDEVQNRLSIGISNNAAKAPVLAVLTKAGIPSDAIVFKMRHPAVANFSLTDRVRDLYGGLRVNTDIHACTLGFNAVYNGDSVFATNGHCSNLFGTSQDQTEFYQIDTTQNSDLIGEEGYESALFDTTADPYGRCPGTDTLGQPYGSVCKWSDLDLIVYNSTAKSAQGVGFLYMPTSRTRYGNNLVVSSSGSNVISIVDKVLNPLVGDTVNKIGSTTGWTYGPISGTCEQIKVVVGTYTYFILCSYEAYMGDYSGDSGAGVFASFDPSADTAVMVGQVFAGDSTNSMSGSWNAVTYFSSVGDMQAEFGTIIMTVYGWF